MSDIDLTAVPLDELRDVAILARGAQLIQAAKDYGFVEGGMEIDVARADDIIAAARERGLEWTDDEATAAAVELIRQANAEAGDG